MRTGNPVLSNRFMGMTGGGALAGEGAATMSIQGTINKATLLIGIVTVAAMFTWTQFMKTQELSDVLPYMLGGLIGGLVLCLAICFMPHAAPFLTPIYAGCEGLFLGGLSAIVETQYPGIAFQAIGLTLGIFIAMLLLYSSRVIRATPAFVRGVMMATGAVFIVYMINMVMGFFGMTVPFLHDASPIGIGVSVVIVIIAALNLILDFHFIEQGVEAGAPKKLEWFGAFGLLVTLVWLYIEVLRLLSKLRSR